MKKLSAGLLLYRNKEGKLEVLIAHMGSPWWAKKDAGAWSIPKGEYQENDDPLSNAKREFKEELGLEVPPGEPQDLGEVKQNNNKIVKAYALEADIDVSRTVSNKVTIEWPPRSGKMQEFPEIDRAGWFSLDLASKKLVAAQAEFLQRLAEKLNMPIEEDSKPPEQGSLF